MAEPEKIKPFHIIQAVRAGNHATANKYIARAMKQDPNLTRQQIVRHVARRVGQKPEVLGATLDNPPKKSNRRSAEQREKDRADLLSTATDDWQDAGPEVNRSDLKALERAGHIETNVRESWKKVSGRGEFFGGTAVRKQRNLEFRRAAGIEPPED